MADRAIMNRTDDLIRLSCIVPYEKTLNSAGWLSAVLGQKMSGDSWLPV